MSNRDSSTNDEENDIQPETAEEEGNFNLELEILRVSNDPKVEKNRQTDRLTDLLAVLMIFSIAMWFRFFARITYMEIFPGSVFHMVIPVNDPLGFGEFLGLNPGELAYTEGFYDFGSYYEGYVQAYSEGWNPYTGSREPGDNIGGYVYGPFYIISISIGHILFGLSVVESIVYSNIILDSLTYVMVYILAKRVTGNVIAFIFALVGSFSPISLFYIAFKGLNAPIMNLSFLLFVYFYLEKKDNLSMFFLAFSILTKQFPLFMAMPIGFWMVRRYGFTKGVAYYLKGIIFTLLLSVPYILYTPILFVKRIFLPGASKPPIYYCPENSEATNLFHSTIPREVCENGNLGINNPISGDLLFGDSDLIFVLINKHILFFGSLIIIAWIGFTAYHYLEENQKLYYVFIAAYYFIAHATIARGVYKYYVTFLVPLMLLAFVVGNKENSWNIKIGATIKNGWKTWFNPKYRQKEATIQYWIYFLILIVSTFGVYWMINSFLSMFIHQNGLKIFWSVTIFIVALVVIAKPTPVKKEFSEDRTDIKTYNDFQYFYIGIGILSLYLLSKLSSYYFGGNTQRFIVNISIIAIFILSFMSLPYLESRNTDRKMIYNPYTLDTKRSLLDIMALIIVFIIIKAFHVELILVHRYYTSLILLLFGLLFMGMLGNQVWSSAINVPVRAYNQYKKLKRKINDNSAFK